MSFKSVFRGALCCAYTLAKTDASRKVVFYHDIGRKWTHMGTLPEVFSRHMYKLRSGDIVCFDDGFRGVWEKRDLFYIEHNRLDNREIKKIVFLAVGLVGQKGYLTWEEIITLQDSYGFEFQCHTWSHQTLVGPWNEEVPIPKNGRTEEWYHHELNESKAELEHRLQRQVTALCFPVGFYSDEVLVRCKRAGYEKVYASYPGNITSNYVQPRCLVQDLSPLAFGAVLKGGMMLFEKRYKLQQYFESPTLAN